MRGCRGWIEFHNAQKTPLPKVLGSGVFCALFLFVTPKHAVTSGVIVPLFACGLQDDEIAGSDDLNIHDPQFGAAERAVAPFDGVGADEFDFVGENVGTDG